MPTLHIHLDEAGNWHFTPRGSKHFILAIAWTFEPEPLAHALTGLRFSMLAEGTNLECFHASPDRQTTRDRVVRTMLADQRWNYAAVVVEKRKINPVLREPHRFYPKFASILLKFVLRGRVGRDATKLLIYADRLPIDTKDRREAVLKAMKTTCAECKPGVEHHVFSHPTESNKWLQVVDYCCWAVWKKWEFGDTRTYDQLHPRLQAPELNVTSGGDQTTYY